MKSLRIYKQLILGYVLVGIGTICLSLKPILVKLVYAEGVDPETTIFIRQLIATVTLWIVVFLYRKKLSFTYNRKDISQILVVGAVGFFVSPLLDFWGLYYVGAIVERMILFTYPIFILLIMSFRYKIPTSKSTVIYAFFIYIGIMLTIGAYDLHSIKVHVFGVILVLLAAVTYAYYLVIASQLVHEIGVLYVNALGMLVSSFFILLYTVGKLMVFHTIPSFNFTFKSYVLLLLISIITTVIPLLTMLEGIKRIGIVSSSIISLFGPVLTIVLGMHFLNETMEMIQWIGCFLVLISVSFLELRKYFPRKK